MRVILYSKPGCHLCEGLVDKLNQVAAIGLPLPSPEPLLIEIRDITSREDWFQAYQYEIPVLYWDSPQGPMPFPRISPRATVSQVAQWLIQPLALAE